MSHGILYTINQRRFLLSTVLHKLLEQGQSIWCDNISRAMISTGELQQLIDLGVTGVTSNPSIFLKAITGSSDYDDLMGKLLGEGRETLSVYEGLVIPDIIDAADILRPVYDNANGLDGYVSLEVNPKLAYDTVGTIAEGRRLFDTVNRPNVMIKVPATEEGIPAVETLIGLGININITLIFAYETHVKVMNAYIEGLKHLQKNGGDLSKVASVASFFVSRVDAMVDKLLLEKCADKKVGHLAGKAAIANAQLAYENFEKTFNALGSFKNLAEAGAQVQRPLWASTSTKNPNYPDTLYVDALVGPHTVNTIPPATLQATLDHGQTDVTLGRDYGAARKIISEIESLGINIKTVTDELTRVGVDLFVQSFDDLLNDLCEKTNRVRAAG